MGIAIIGTGSYVPEKSLTNFDLEKIVNTSDEWIRSRSGIESRRIAAPEEHVSDLGLVACLRALEMGGAKAEDIDMIVLSSTSVEYTFPSTACELQRKLGNTKAFCFDLQAACSGFVYSLEAARSFMVGNPGLKRVLVVGAEKMSAVVDWSDRNTCVLFGDAASAVLLANDHEYEDCIIATKLGSNGEYLDKLLIPAGGSRLPASHDTVDQHMHYLKMDGQAIFRLAVNYMYECSRDLMAETGFTAEQIDWLVPHQANLRIMSATAERLKISGEKVFANVQNYGNTCAATIPLALDEMLRKNLLKKGQVILLTAVGGGLTWGSTLLRWPISI